MIETLVDMSDAAEALCIDPIIPLSRFVTVALAGRIGGSRVGMFAGVCIIVVAEAVIALEVIGAAPYATDARVGVGRWTAKVTAVELKPILASSEALLLPWEPYSRWSLAVLNCRALQAQIPSCHA